MQSSAGFGFLVAGLAALHILVAPFTKVEESFNVQAVHDLCHLGWNVSLYDHINFPGVVPRTFLGAIAVAVPACPLMKVASLAGFSKLSGLYIERFALAGYSLAGLWYLKRAVSHLLGRSVGTAFVLIIGSQFHLLYYAGRPLPNTLALPLVAVSAALWMRKQAAASVCILTFTTAVVRCDLAPLLGLIGLQMLLSRQLTLSKAVLVGTSALLCSTIVSVIVDSFFWRRWLWPEGAVLWFNTAENRSSEWGVQPFHWYFTSALPRALLGSLPLAVTGAAFERRVRLVTVITLLYISIYSLLPHKELRFLLPVLPLLNIPAAAGLSWVWQRRRKSTIAALQCLAALGLVMMSSAATVLFLAVSRTNYPGGEAMLKLHELSKHTGTAAVHIGVLPAMTGVTRFGEVHLNWTYSKEENLKISEMRKRRFTYLLSAERYVPGYEVVDSILSFSHIELRLKPKELLQHLVHLQAPIKIRQHDSVHIQKYIGLDGL